MKFKNLLVDLDNTLYDYNEPHKNALAKVYEICILEFDISSETLEAAFETARTKTQLELYGRAASHNRLLYFQLMLEILGISSLKHSMLLYNSYWDTFLRTMTLFDKVYEYLDSFHRDGGKICVITDLTAHIQYRKIEKLQLGDYFDFIVTSEEVGVEKPHPYIFIKALNKLGCSADEVVMVGDNWNRDIVGATNLGIPSIWINHKQEKKILSKGITEVFAFDQIAL